MAEKKSLGKELTKGFIIENPVLRLVLGTCPTLATTTSVSSAIGMGVSASIVLICSNIVISALRKVIPQKVRIPAYIVIIASFVTIVQMLVKAFVPVLNEQLGVYLPLIVVNCIILGRAELSQAKTACSPRQSTDSAWESASPVHSSLWVLSVKSSAQAHSSTESATSSAAASTDSQFPSLTKTRCLYLSSLPADSLYSAW